MDYYIPKAAEVPWYSTKYDACTIHATGKDYKYQQGSGRSEVLKNFAEDGATLGDISKRAALAGFDPKFTIDACFKHAGSKDCAWVINPPEGTTIEAIKAIRVERELTPEQIARREQRAAEMEEKRKAKEAARTEREAERKAKIDADRAARAAEREQEKARKAAEAAAARAAAKDAARQEAEAEGAPPETKKGKGKGKKATAAALPGEFNPEESSATV
jgi:hypothetical protein